MLVFGGVAKKIWNEESKSSLVAFKNPKNTLKENDRGPSFLALFYCIYRIYIIYIHVCLSPLYWLCIAVVV